MLQRIFIEVCPLTVDGTYDSSEESLVDYGCALCDVKDLAQCALVSRRWWSAAQDLLYVEFFQPLCVKLIEARVQVSKRPHRTGALLRARI
jgi:F-box-like